MRRGLILLSLLSVLSVGLASAADRVVRATGHAVQSVEPDQATVSVGVVTRAPTAEQAAADNAAQVEAVLAALRQTLDGAGQMRTINYSLTPDYRRTSGQPAVLVGFIANNTVEVTVTDLSLIGQAIDAATQAGANSVHGLRFGLQDPQPVRARVLGLAAKQAQDNADAIAAGLGAQTGSVLVAQEGVFISPLNSDFREAAAGGGTPVEPGLVQVRATVTVELELIQ